MSILWDTLIVIVSTTETGWWIAKCSKIRFTKVRSLDSVHHNLTHAYGTYWIYLPFFSPLYKHLNFQIPKRNHAIPFLYVYSPVFLHFSIWNHSSLHLFVTVQHIVLTPPLHISVYTNTAGGRTEAQAVSRRPLSEETRLISQGSPCGNFGRKNGKGQGFILSELSHQCFIIIRSSATGVM